MGRFIHFDENEDGTVTVSADFGDSVGVRDFVIDISLETMFGMIGRTEESRQEAIELASHVVMIPNAPEQ